MEKLKNDICEKLWLENEASLRKICRVKMQSHPDIIDDIISDTFLALCQYVSENNNVPNIPKAWLYGTLNNIINQKYRKIYKTEKSKTSLSEKEYNLHFTSGGIEDKIDEIYSYQIKDKLKYLLNDDEYQIIKYIHYDELKVKDVAKILNSTESAIKQKHYRICNKLRKIIKNSKNF
ncbi:MAG: sigma-70 family RNA polymerase sigma factor [Faecalibacterium sp.]|nr:sigma-70 family RNA polymerase sigma factor [Ruminococcus sp.]MCM1392382.1 sigma-70 family RNA polymerase sigma factor [Ruminococcus sp.]MCM1486266.1 sigma-70 family RNA polymerase sigma factor [Faecalibacterium sp.]